MDDVRKFVDALWVGLCKCLLVLGFLLVVFWLPVFVDTFGVDWRLLVAVLSLVFVGFVEGVVGLRESL